MAGALASTGANGRERLHALAWTGKESDVGVWAVASDDLGRTWTQPARMGDASAKQLDLAASGGCLTAVWDEYRAEKKRRVVLAATSCDGARTWTTPAVLSDAAADAATPLVVGTARGVLAAWTERVGTGAVGWSSRVLASPGKTAAR